LREEDSKIQIVKNCERRSVYV